MDEHGLGITIKVELIYVLTMITSSQYTLPFAKTRALQNCNARVTR